MWIEYCIATNGHLSIIEAEECYLLRTVSGCMTVTYFYE
jgi:hypothetical protein